MDERRTYDFMGDNARRFMGLPIANPDPSAAKPGIGKRLTVSPNKRWTGNSAWTKLPCGVGASGEEAT